ncbi:glycosyltransferase family 2 protein [Treponema sp. OMZ 799]|uniref:glycosyltransferase family 2 protein n=1 Tax=Treponema sp. OMZ 799 TaxID=2563668 RepID=UPI0020A4A66E|nr:glycosyltransferase family A protein [Treponema sp. OMZ 799]UTC77832.1 glycosyltransferase family 2 protein [Treponema sp. OMZ 799]
MKFSIIMPVYNTGKYVETAILSVLNQTYSDYELICVNDGSTDRSTEILNKFANIEKVFIIKNDYNAGPLAARITGVAFSKGDYILFLDSDDWLEPNALDTLFCLLKKESWDYVEFPYYEVRNNIKKRNIFSCEDKNKNIIDILLSNANHTIWNKCFDSYFLKSVCEKIKSFFSIASEDYYQISIIEYYAKKRKRIHTPLYNYRQDSGITNFVNFSNPEKFKLIDMSLNNVYKNLCDFFISEECKGYICYIKDFNDSLYTTALKNTTSQEVINIIKTRFGETGFMLLLLKEINNLDTQIKEIKRIYRPLVPFSKLIRPMMNILRRCREYIAERR